MLLVQAKEATQLHKGQQTYT